MYLKSLEVVGFKSFAPPTIVNFHRGVTAIVGPNGCGKSNVLDSIRWVLGETSAKALRGSSMSDVIFSGTDSRKPMGMAEVALTFAECEKELGVEYNEVRICRRVFRDGRSEYEINKTPCRLKDIHKLFMDTGIGRSAYSIMEQGKLDQILSSKPEDRRAIFEEAAGITRFKSQKKEALRKLELTEANLLRVTDIVKEVNRQIGSLQRQANKARRYKEVFTRLQDLDTRLAHHDYGTLKAKLDEGEGLVQNLRGQYDEIQSTVEVREETVRQRRAEVERLEQNIRSLDQERNAADSKALRSRQQVTYNTLRIEELESLKVRNSAEITVSEDKLNAERSQFDAVNAESSKLEAELQQIRNELAEHKERAEASKRAVADNLAQRSKFESQINALDKALNEAKNRIAGIEIQKKNYSVRFAKLDEDEELFKVQKVELEATCAKLAEKNAGLKKEIETLTAKLTSDQQALTASEAQLKTVREKEEKARRALEENQNGIRALETMLQVHAGYSEGTRKILESYRGKGVVGTLLEHLKVQAGYEKAVEAALGAACEAVMVENAESLEKIVAELGESGALAFTDLSAANREVTQTVVDAKPVKSFWGKIAGMFGSAQNEKVPSFEDSHSTIPTIANYVQCDELVKKLATRILDGFLFVENADEALTISRIRSDRHIVTRMGEVWYKEGWQLRGQAKDGKQSVLQYENQLAELKKQTDALQKNHNDANGEVSRLASDLDNKRNGVAALQKQKQEAEAQLSAAQYEEKGFLRQREDAGNRLQAVMHERTSLNAQTGTDGDDFKKLKETLKQFESERLQKTEARESLELKFGELNVEVEQWTQALTECRVKEAAALQRIDSIRQQNASLTARFHELEQAVERLRNEIADYETKIVQSREGIVQAEEAIKLAEEEVQLHGVKIGEIEAIKKGILEELVGIEESLRSDRKLATELQTQYSRAEVQAAEQRMKLEALTTRISRQYQIDLSLWTPPPYNPNATQPVAEEPAVSGEAQEAPAEIAEANAGDANGEVAEQPAEEPVAEQPANDGIPAEVEPVELDWAQVEAEVAELREKLDRMGPVNVDAITEFEELEQRQVFLNKQEQDLIQARDQLHEAIKKINQTTQVLFAETFEKVKVNFSEMFLEIFGGGKAELKLQDENDPLECGIDIIARPPGKQLTSISLLSGGERTMTAVALMFAIYMVKPSPFCFLDEMDAPLDESNINRFIRILQRFVKQSQFVVITHNKRTISSADVLYGVTMEEHGVSKIVSVKLSRKDEDPLFNGEEKAPRSIADSIRGESVVPDSII
ncbi:MAG: chromosome segregation protein SMC [Verrucomicrobiales bacterium]|jgi:chromosome segregation protein|nr:chromosome segregation protein SMC [Verrucomicrobiales bacterium]